MSRSTQFIGLTKEAERYISGLKELESDSFANGLIEKIPLKRWIISEDFECCKDRPSACLREVVQAAPWSSGPMIFTCLEADFGNKCKAKFLQWIDDPRIREQEFDYEKGRFWA